MNLVDQAVEDLQAVLEDTAGGASKVLSLTSPAGLTVQVNGIWNDIAREIDSDTGQTVSGRTVTVVVHLASLKAAGCGVPVGIADSNRRPWLVQVLDLSGVTRTYKVSRVDPDGTVGALTCFLEQYEL